MEFNSTLNSYFQGKEYCSKCVAWKQFSTVNNGGRGLFKDSGKKSELENSDVNAHVGLHASFNGISIRLVEIKKINCFHSRRVSSPSILMGYAIGL